MESRGRRVPAGPGPSRAVQSWSRDFRVADFRVSECGIRVTESGRRAPRLPGRRAPQTPGPTRIEPATTPVRRRRSRQRRGPNCPGSVPPCTPERLILAFSARDSSGRIHLQCGPPGGGPRAAALRVAPSGGPWCPEWEPLLPSQCPTNTASVPRGCAICYLLGLAWVKPVRSLPVPTRLRLTQIVRSGPDSESIRAIRTFPGSDSDMAREGERGPAGAGCSPMQSESQNLALGPESTRPKPERAETR